MAAQQITTPPPFSFTVKTIEVIARDICRTRLQHINTSGSLATIRDLPVMTTTNIYMKFGGKSSKSRTAGSIELQKEGIRTAAEAMAYLRTSIRNEMHDILNKGHMYGALKRDSNGDLKRTRQMISTEKTLSDDSTFSVLDTLSADCYTPEERIGLNEHSKFCEFLNSIHIYLLETNQEIIMDELTNIQSLSPKGLVERLMFEYGMEYAKNSVEHESIHKLIQTLWPKTPLPKAGLTTWNSNLNEMQDKLREAEANFGYIIKQYTLRATKPGASEEELFGSDTPRESLRKSLGHSEAGLALVSLCTLLQLRANDEYQSELLKFCQRNLEKAVKVHTGRRKNYPDVAKLSTSLTELQINGTIPTRKSMRAFLAPIVYDESFDKLTARKQNSIRRLIRSAGLLSEGLRPLLKSASLKYT